MTPSTLVLAACSFLLLFCALLVVMDGGGSRRLLRARVMSTRELKALQPGLDDSYLNGPAEQTFLLRLASWAGYQADLPPAFAASPRIVLPIAGIVGIVANNLVGRMLPAPAAVVAGLMCAWLAARFAFKRKRKRYTSLLFKQIPDTMSLMLRAVRAGLPVAEAIRNVGRESMSPTREEFARVAGETALGSPVEVALRRLADRTNIQEYAFFAVIVGLSSQTGGNLSETLENMADLVRRRVAMVAKGKALSAEGRLSAGVVGALPFAVALLTSITNPDYLKEFVVNPNGPTLIIAFVVLLSTGLLVTHLMIQRSMED